MKFRQKPVVIEAIQYDGSEYSRQQIFNMSAGAIDVSTDSEGKMTIASLEGRMLASIGDWIIKGVNGEFYPCKPDIFEKTYEPAE